MDTEKLTLIGIDTGGTFTDFVLYRDEEIIIHKVPSSPQHPEKAILQGIDELQLSPSLLHLTHGSTVATNAVLERKGARCAYITNKGLGDTLLIGRQARQKLYDLNNTSLKALVDEQQCIEVDTRRASNGDVVQPLTESAIHQLVAQVRDLNPESVAINLLFSFVNGEDELRIKQALAGVGFVCTSHEVLPEVKEYERGLATFLNAYVGPKIDTYLNNLSDALPGANVAIMLSAGGSVPMTVAAKNGVQMLLSGPAGGLIAAKHVGAQVNCARLLTFDMGGTSTDVSVIDGDIALTSDGKIGGIPVSVPMVDMHTIGAGGGSIAYIDAGGALQVGPESAGATPGPACYGKGGVLPTVTDANAVLGRIVPEFFMDGALKLDLSAAEAAIDVLARGLALTRLETAQGIIDVANEAMLKALKVMSIERGHDPKDFVLMPFGGAGGLHVCALAQKLQIRKVVIPQNAGVLSALGMLVAAESRVFSQSVNCDLQALDEVESKFKQLKSRALRHFSTGSENKLDIQLTVDVRFAGQSSALTVKWNGAEATREQFLNAYQARYKYLVDAPLELTKVTVVISRPAQQFKSTFSKCDFIEPDQKRTSNYEYDGVQVPIYPRSQFKVGEVVKGPAIIAERVSTTWLEPGWAAQCDAGGHIYLERSMS